MWIITTFGFFSAVEKPEDRGTPFLTVRARVHADLAALIKRVGGKRPKIGDDNRGDYRFRARIRRDALARVVAESIQSIDYSNFKNEVRSRQGATRERTYHRVWDVLADMQPTRPFAGARPWWDDPGYPIA